MKNFSTLTKSIVIALGLAGIGSAAVAADKMVNSGEHVSKAVAVEQSKVSLDEAIKIAQGSAQGDLIEVEFDQKDHSAMGKYEIEFVNGDHKIEVKIDANTGEIIKTKEKRLDKDDLGEYNTMKQAGLSLTDAMHKAVQTVDGHVVEAEFDVEDGQAMYEIEIAKGDQVHKLVIDATSGDVVENKIDK